MENKWCWECREMGCICGTEEYKNKIKEKYKQKSKGILLYLCEDYVYRNHQVDNEYLYIEYFNPYQSMEDGNCSLRVSELDNNIKVEYNKKFE